MNTLYINSITFNVTQEGNTQGSTEEYEDLQILVEAPLFIEKEEEFYYVLKTSTGWSINDKEELGDLLDKCKASVNAFLTE